MDPTEENVELLLSLGAAPVLIPILVAHIKDLVNSIVKRYGEDGSPWPFVTDVLGVVWVLLLWQSGNLPDEIDNELTAGMLGLALGLGSGFVRDQAVTRFPQLDRRNGAARGAAADPPPEPVLPSPPPRPRDPSRPAG